MDLWEEESDQTVMMATLLGVMAALLNVWKRPAIPVEMVVEQLLLTVYTLGYPSLSHKELQREVRV